MENGSMEMDSHSHSSVAAGDVKIEPANALPFCLFALSWILSPVAFKLALAWKRKSSKWTQNAKFFAAGANALCVLLVVLGLGLSTLPVADIKVTMWLLVVGYAVSVAIAFVKTNNLFLKKFEFISKALAFTFLPFMALWLYSGLTSKPVIFYGDGFGHLLPGCLNCLITIQPLSSRNLLDLQRRESNLLIIGSIAAYFMHMSGTRGSVVGNLVYQDRVNIVKNVQHSSDLIIVFASGVMGRVFHSFDWATGLHILVPGICNVVTMYHHPQPSQMATILHVSFGIATLLTGVLRMGNRIPEYMFIGILGAFNFTIGTPYIGAWASGWSDPYGFLFLYYVAVMLYTSYVFRLFVDPATVSRDWRMAVTGDGLGAHGAISGSGGLSAADRAQQLHEKDVGELDLGLDDETQAFSLGTIKSDSNLRVLP